MRTYNFWTHWTTTDQELEWAIESFEVTPEESILIDEWANLESDNWELFIDYTTIQ